MRKSFKVILIGTLLVALVAIGFLFYRMNSSKDQSIPELRFASAVKGDISSNVSGSGELVSLNRTQVLSNVAGEIIEVNFSEGDVVTKGSIIAKIDKSDALENIEKIKSDIERNKNLLELRNVELYSLNIVAPFRGQITDILVSEGQSTARNNTILELTDTKTLKATMLFSGNIIDDLRISDIVNINIVPLMQTVEGRITYINKNPYPIMGGKMAIDVQVEFDNPGSIMEAMDVTAEINLPWGSAKTLEKTKVEYSNKAVLRTASGGMIKDVIINKNQFVDEGDPLIRIENDDLIESIEEINERLIDLNNRLKLAKEALDDYTIYSPIDGIIVKSNVVESSSVRVGDEIFIVSNNQNMMFDISIDELDIVNISIGQSVLVSLDAVSQTISRPLSGYVTNIAIEGRSDGGVTNYPVTISIDGNYEHLGLRAGMNADARVLLSDARDVLKIPIEAVGMQRGGYYVMVESDMEEKLQEQKDSESLEESEGVEEQISEGIPQVALAEFGNMADKAIKYYENAIRQNVEVGIHNEEFIEIKDGLKEGDKFILPPIFSVGTVVSVDESDKNSGLDLFGDISGTSRVSGDSSSSDTSSTTSPSSGSSSSGGGTGGGSGGGAGRN